jgi:choline dehydrogenase
MMYVCGNDRDFNSWAAAGNLGWDYQNILKLIKTFEKNNDTSRSSAYHGFAGKLSVSNYKTAEPFADTLEAAFNEIGYSTVPDYNAQVYNGFTRLQATINNGERCGAYRAFIVPAKARPNLFIMKNSVVTNIIFNGTKATGVNVRTKYTTCSNIVITATKEVILSAGALGSPKILLQSGIGRPTDLTPLGIKSIKNLPVGENLQNHVLSVHFIKVNPKSETQTILGFAGELMDFFYNRKGFLSQVGTLNAGGLINTLSSSEKYPDVQMIFYKFSKDQMYFDSVLANFGFKDEYIEQLVQANAQHEIVMVYNILLNPKSKGTYKLRDNNPDSKPIINPNYLSNAEDVDTLIRGANKITELVNSSAMAPNEAEIMAPYIEECDGLEYGTDDFWKCYFKYFTQDLWHPTGTCKMGRVGDPSAVVDPYLKLQGFTNIRVADASIMPSVPSGNTQCPTYAVGQKAADIILKAWP